MDPIMIAILTWVGVVASLFGAGVSIHQACRIKTIRDQIVLDRSKRSFINLLGVFKNVRKESRKLISIQNHSVQGVDENAVLDAIQDAADKLFENSHRKNFHKITQSLTTIRDLLHNYRTGQGNKADLAEGIHRRINDITKEISKQIDKTT